jgi:tetratricopeptide (TPR) repeat protein
MDEYFCSNCKKNIIPEKQTKKILFISKVTVSCPRCGSFDLKSPQPNGNPEDIGQQGSIPTLQHFLHWYNKGEYNKALGIPPGSSKDIVRKAIDDFQMEHIASAPEWSIPIANIREQILNKVAPIKPQQTGPKTVDKRSWKTVLPYLEEADKLESQKNYSEAMNWCTKAIESSPTCYLAYQKRAWIGLLSPDFKRLLDQIIDDCTTSIEYDPHNYQTYNDRGRAYARKGDLEMASNNYHRALEFNPSYVIAALNAMEADICLGKYQLVVGTFGSFRRDVASSKDLIVAHSLACIALALDGKEYRDKLAPLHDKSIRVRNLVDWCTVEIDHNLENLERQGYNPDRLKKAKEIHLLFRNHFD